ncbi:MAG: pteridine reductase [Candidatus Polarisedimenticolaceae bacterium]|nr:pteridine reductase [Candidatus Polarisedimenticolaceae bacterium]
MTEIQQPLAGKVALITGAAHRIGAQIARTLHDNGMDLTLHYRHSAAAAQALKAELEATRPGSVALLQADLNQTDLLPGLIHDIQLHFGRLDLLVNNASSFYPTPVASTRIEQWDELINSNLKAPFFLSQAAAPLLRESKGCIINLIDIHAERPLKDHPVYSIAKAGNAMLVKALAQELAPDVRVNGIAPGAILWPEQALPPNQQEAILRRTALKRRGAASDIAKSLLFLFKDADYITGQIITVDGGRTLQQ